MTAMMPVFQDRPFIVPLRSVLGFEMVLRGCHSRTAPPYRLAHWRSKYPVLSCSNRCCCSRWSSHLRFAPDDDGVLPRLQATAIYPHILAVDVLDIKTGRWSVKEPMPYGVGNVGAAVYEGRIWLVGSIGERSAESMHKVLVYDPQSNKWATESVAMLTNRAGAQLVVGRNIV
jgi:hypothetical protein